MDGVPFMVQPYVYPGDHFDYAFTPPDAGTFWYHPHCNTLMQMGHGLTGVIVVENPNDPQFDAEVVLNLRDWRLGDDGQFIGQFCRAMRRRRVLRNRPHRQLDGRAAIRCAGRRAGAVARRDHRRHPDLRLPAGGAEGTVIALDGNPVPQRFQLDGLQLGPGQRLELAIRMPDSEGAIVSLKDVRGTKPKVLATLRARAARSNAMSAILRRLRSIRCRKWMSRPRSTFHWR